MTHDKDHISKQAQNLEKRKRLASNRLDSYIFLATAFIAVVLFYGFSAHADSFNGPWRHHRTQEVSQNQKDHTSNPLRFMVEAYRNNISPIDGKHCPMYPSCSAYSVQCFKKHGFLVGWIMTCDRLYRCGRDEVRLSPEIRVNGESRTYDPAENNDFWWHNAP